MTHATQAVTAQNEVSLYVLGKCVDVRGSNAANGTVVQIFDCNGGTNQRWQFWTDGTVRPSFNTNKCLDLPSADTDDGTPIQIYDCHGSENQKWVLSSTGTLQGFGAKCVDDPGFSTTNGTGLQYYDCNGGTNQNFAIAPPSGVNLPTSSPSALQYSYLYSQTPDPKATDSKSVSLLSAIQTTETLAKDGKSIADFIKGMKDASTLVQVGAALSGAGAGIDTVITLLNFLGVLPKPPDEVAALTKEVSQDDNGQTWQDLENYIDMNYGPIANAALVQVPTYGAQYDADGKPGDDAASIGLTNLYADSAWHRVPVGSGTDSTTDHSLNVPLAPYPYNDAWTALDNWKQDVKPPTIGSDDLVFEWRVAAPILLKAIALRLATLAAEDPNFMVDHAFDPEISMMRSNLISRYQTMLGGVQCGYQNYTYAMGFTPSAPTTDNGQGCIVVCADIYSGMAALSAISPTSELDKSVATCDKNKNSVAFADMQNYTAQSIRTRMPLFEMQSMIDLLYTFVNPGPDLTQNTHRISPQSQPSLCVGTVGQSGAWGTDLQLSTCNAADPSQFWVYNRTTGQISNPRLGVCIDERSGTSAGTHIGVWGCDAPHAETDDPQGPLDTIDNLAQKWSFDPTTGQLRNALGVAMAWFINPLSPQPASVGNLIVTEVAGQGGGFLTPPLDNSSPSVNMAWQTGAPTKGDGNADGLTDIRLAGAGWGNIPVAKNRGGGNFNGEIWSVDDTDFTYYWATTPNVKILSGDFDGDGYADIALTGGAGWGSIPVAFGTSGSSFHVTNSAPDWVDFAAWAASPGVSAVTGDFNGDGRTDIALTGGSGWWTIPVAFSNGDGTFHVTDQSVDTTFNSNAVQPGARPVIGDFNGDGLSDIALVGGTSANSIVIALSNGDSNFTIQVQSVVSGDTNFAYYSTLPGVQAVAGDFNGDGYGDIALTGGSGWWTIPIAFSTNGAFSVSNNGIAWGDGNFPTYASWAGVKAVAGDFDGDGHSDIALTGGSGWGSIPVAYSIGDGTWGVTNDVGGGNFPAEAATSGVTALGGAY